MRQEISPISDGGGVPGAGAPPARWAVASWNIHRARGSDGVVDPARIARVLRDEVCAPHPAPGSRLGLGLGLEALILQEADEETPPHRGILDLPRIEVDTGLRHVHADPAHRWGAHSHGFLGTIVFLHPSHTVEAVTLLDLPGHCHRGAVIVDFLRAGQPLRLVGLHLSLSQGLRVMQMRTLGQHLKRRSPRTTLIAGDLNEWRPWGGLALTRQVTGLRLAGPVRATFPVSRPLLPLDRVLVTAPARVMDARVLDGAGIRAASDHRPIRAEVALAG